MTNFFKKHGRDKLYRQWVEKAGLSPEDLPPDMKKDTGETTEFEDDSGEDVFPHRGLQGGTGRSNGIITIVSGRLIIIMGLIIVVLLVLVSVLSTVLALRGC